MERRLLEIVHVIDTPGYGVELALLASIVLAGSSIPRAIKTKKPLPIGLSGIAAFGLYNFGLAYINTNRL